MKIKIDNKEYHIYEIHTNEKIYLLNTSLIDDPESTFISVIGTTLQCGVVERIFILTRINRIYKRNHFLVRQSGHRPRYLSIKRIIPDPEPSLISMTINVGNTHYMKVVDYMKIKQMIEKIVILEHGK